MRTLNGIGDIFSRRDPAREALGTCTYALTSTSDEPLRVESRTGPPTNARGGGYLTITGTITAPPAVRQHEDRDGTFDLRLDNGQWLTFRFRSPFDNDVMCSGAPRSER